jgi:hypothetical protein
VSSEVACCLDVRHSEHYMSIEKFKEWLTSNKTELTEIKMTINNQCIISKGSITMDSYSPHYVASMEVPTNSSFQKYS